MQTSSQYYPSSREFCNLFRSCKNMRHQSQTKSVAKVHRLQFASGPLMSTSTATPTSMSGTFTPQFFALKGPDVAPTSTIAFLMQSEIFIVCIRLIKNFDSLLLSGAPFQKFLLPSSAFCFASDAKMAPYFMAGLL